MSWRKREVPDFQEDYDHLESEYITARRNRDLERLERDKRKLEADRQYQAQRREMDELRRLRDEAMNQRDALRKLSETDDFREQLEVLSRALEDQKRHEEQADPLVGLKHDIERTIGIRLTNSQFSNVRKLVQKYLEDQDDMNYVRRSLGVPDA